MEKRTASSDLDNARRSLDICSTPRFSEEKVLVRDCSAEEAAVLRAEEYYQGAQKELQAAEVEVRSAREEINQAQARIACCNQGVGYAEKAVKESIIAQTHAERSLEEARAAERQILASERKVREAEELTEQMLSEVHQADTFTNEAQITYQNAEKMQEAARRYGTMGSQEVEYRIEQLYRLNRPDLNL